MTAADLYDSLQEAGRQAIHNWSDAATSKALHQLGPSVFVMWDKNIKPYAADYQGFLVEMHRLGVRLVDESPVGPDEVEGHLQRLLDYRVPKTFARYLDEHNWYVLVGAAQLGR